MTYLELNGGNLSCFRDFADAVGNALGVEYFGWDLNSFQDCLHGGYGGEPPYTVRIVNGETFLRAFNSYSSTIQYWRMVSERIAERELDRDFAREQHAIVAELLIDAASGKGDTLLRALLGAFSRSGSTLEVLMSDAASVDLKTLSPTE